MAGHSVLENFSGADVPLLVHSGLSVIEYEARRDLKSDRRDADRGNSKQTDRGLSNHVQLRQAAVLPQVFGVFEARKVKRQESSQQVLLLTMLIIDF